MPLRMQARVALVADLAARASTAQAGSADLAAAQAGDVQAFQRLARALLPGAYRDLAEAYLAQVSSQIQALAAELSHRQAKLAMDTGGARYMW